MSNTSSVLLGCLLSEGLPLNRSMLRHAAVSSYSGVMSVSTNAHPQKHTQNKAQTNNLLSLALLWLLSQSPLTSKWEYLKNMHLLSVKVGTLKSLTFDL